MILTLLALCTPAAYPAPELAPPIALDSVDELIARGKQELVKGEVAAAVETFAKAHLSSNGTTKTELWVLRGQIATGQAASAFERITVIEANGHESNDLDYVIGAARYALGKAEEAKGSGAAGGLYGEAAAYLVDVTAKAPDGYPDAWRMLAASARWTGEMETAAAAIDRALEQEQSAATLTLASKIRVARGAAMVGDEKTKDAGTRYLEQGVKDAAAAAKALGEDKRAAGPIADVHLQRAVALLFLGRKDAAATAYVDAIGWDPTQADYGQMMTSLRDTETGDKLFIDTLGNAAAAFEARWGKKYNSDAALHWYRGYAQHFAQDYKGSTESFETSVAKFPAYANAYWYIGANHAWTEGADGTQAAEAWMTYRKLDKNGFLNTLRTDPTATGYVGRVIGILWNDSRGGANLETCVELAELNLESAPKNAKFWNNVGLMCRDAGAWVKAAKPKSPKKSVDEYFARAWEAYSKAIELDRRPEFLNDGAVILHYYIEDRYDEAIALYDEAEALAQEWLDKGDLTGDDLDVVKIALRDAKNNRKALRRKIERQKSGGAGGGAGGAGGSGKD